MELIAYQVGDNPPTIRPALRRRSWMDDTGGSYAYLCVPLVMANVAGWELLCPVSFSAYWDGSIAEDGVKVTPTSRHPIAPVSHFGSGILTFFTGYVFRTSPGHNLWVKGPTNEAKDGLTALEAIVETDWLPYTFTMNYRFTRAQHVIRFEAGEPFCHVHPFPRHYLESVEPTLRLLTANPSLEIQHQAWEKARHQWNERRMIPGSSEARQKWRKDYLKGQTALGDKASEHQSATELRPFQDERGTDVNADQEVQRRAVSLLKMPI